FFVDDAGLFKGIPRPNLLLALGLGLRLRSAGNLAESVCSAGAGRSGGNLEASLPVVELVSLFRSVFGGGLLVEGEVEVDVGAVGNRPPQICPGRSRILVGAARTPGRSAATVAPGNGLWVLQAVVAEPSAGWDGVEAGAADVARVIAAVTQKQLA